MTRNGYDHEDPNGMTLTMNGAANGAAEVLHADTGAQAARPSTPHPDAREIPRAVARLRTYFEAGKTRPLGWRQAQLAQLRAMLTEHADEFVAALRADLGKPPLEAWITDISIVLNEIELAARSLEAWTRPEKVATPITQQPGVARIVREPLGVVLVIAPWNYPLQLLLSPLVGALAAGNAVVLKPSEVAVHTSALLGRLVPRYLDRDGVALVEGGVGETTALLTERFDHIFYTGNGRVGRIVMEAAAKHLTPVTLELGGKSPCIVAADADLEVTARRIVWGKFLNAGQTCIAPDYVLVHPSRETELLSRMKAALTTFYGDDPRASADYGRIVNEQHHRRLAALLADGEVVAGGQTDAATRYVAPTILRNVAPDAPIMTDEIFGPILPVLRIATIDAAIAFVNARPKPLALYAFTRSPAVEEAIVARTSSGGVCVNGTLWHIANPALPFGGVGASGTGGYHGRHTFETFTHRKPVVTKSTRLDPSLTYPPYGALKSAILRRLL
jgi:aldehyde dehydrogenase (NAD+)